MTQISVRGTKEIIRFLDEHCAGSLEYLRKNVNGLSLCVEPLKLPHIDGFLSTIAEAVEEIEGKFTTLRTGGTAVDTPDPGTRIRYEIRSLLNLVVGYTELIGADVAEQDATLGRLEVQSILNTSQKLLTGIDGLADLIDTTTSSLSQLTKDFSRIIADVDAKRLNGRILVIDDSEVNQLIIKNYLTIQGHQITLASSGVEGLGMLDQADYDLILLDMVMPDMSGLAVLEHLKRSGKHRNVPVIVISGLTDVDAVAPCIAAGAEDYLTKPFNPVLLRSRIESSLQKKHWADRERAYLAQIETEKAKSERLLSAILPDSIIKRLQSGEHPIADHYANATVLFADIVGFTALARTVSPEDLVTRLDALFTGFDDCAKRHGVEKIKTIGDAYMATCGALLDVKDHADRCVAFGQDMLRVARAQSGEDFPIALRIGIHSGPVVSGLVGSHRYTFDVWGETVNHASRIESNAQVGRVCLSNKTRESLLAIWNTQSLGKIDLKGIGLQEIFKIE